MKTKLTQNKKFNLEKIEVAKLNKSQMTKIYGGLGGGKDEPQTITDTIVVQQNGPITH